MTPHITNIGSTLYFNTSTCRTSTDETGEPKVETFYDFYAYENGTVKKKNVKSLDMLTVPYKEKNGRVCWMDYGQPYSTDKITGDVRKESFETDGPNMDNKFYVSISGRKSEIATYSVCLFNGETRQPILDDLAYFREYGDKLISIEPRARRKVLGDSIYYGYDNKIYVCDGNGENKRVLCTLPEDVYFCINGNASNTAWRTNTFSAAVAQLFFTALSIILSGVTLYALCSIVYCRRVSSFSCFSLSKRVKHKKKRRALFIYETRQLLVKSGYFVFLLIMIAVKISVCCFADYGNGERGEALYKIYMDNLAGSYDESKADYIMAERTI